MFGLDISRLRVRFVLNKMALWFAYHQVFQFYNVSVIPPMFQTHLLTSHERYQILTIEGVFK